MTVTRLNNSIKDLEKQFDSIMTQWTSEYWKKKFKISRKKLQELFGAKPEVQGCSVYSSLKITAPNVNIMISMNSGSRDDRIDNKYKKKRDRICKRLSAKRYTLWKLKMDSLNHKEKN